MKRIGVLVVLVAALALSACGSSSNSNTSSSSTSGGSASSGDVIQSNSANSSKTVTIGSKNFTEEFILGQIYAQALKAAGYNVKTQLNLGSETIGLKAIQDGQISGYPEYTSTVLESFFHAKPQDVPPTAAGAYKQAKADFAKEGMTA